MKAIASIFALALLGGLCLAGPEDHGGRRVIPVYVGSRVCGECHWGKKSGNQYEKWLHSPHAGAYAALWTSAAKEIARLSGIPAEPQESLVCLGCHATAWDTEGWERDETFVLEDGVQCERCHGPGSEYIRAEVMINREKALKHGLRLPRERDCLMCHMEKGSHTAVLGPSGFDLEEWWMRLGHPQPATGGAHVQPRTELRVSMDARPSETPHLLGARNCKSCHQGRRMGYQFSRWRGGPHASAYAVLATDRGREIADERGISADPQLSEVCLSCHTTGAGLADGHFAPGFDRSDGVQCESCHGAGSEYSSPDAMGDADAAHGPGLATISEELCLACHGDAHGAPFDYPAALEEIAHPTHLPEATLPDRYKTPLNLAVTSDGAELYVACEASNSVIIVDTATRQVITEVETGGQATDVSFNPAGTLAYVSNRLDDTVTIVDTATRKAIETFAVGDEPHGVLFDAPGEHLYILDTGANSISIMDPATNEETRRLAAGRNPWSLALSPDGATIAVTNTLAELAELRQNTHSELTLIDTATGRVSKRVELPDTNLCQGVAWHPGGEFLAVTLNRTKSLVPMTRLLQGWTITNGFGLVWKSGRVDQLLLDMPDTSFPDTADVAFSPDGRWAFFTSSGSDRLAVVDVEKLLSMVAGASDHEREQVFPNHLGKPVEFIAADLPTGKSPRGVTFDPEGEYAYVANSLDDTVTVIDVASLTAVDTIDLGGSKEITKIRWGEQLFHSAGIAFRRQFSCHSCHPDGNVDGVTYDIEPDGIGLDPVDNRTLRGILDTAPFKWSGLNPTLSRQCGPRLAVFFSRIDPFTADELDALTTYICTIPRPPNRFRPLGADLTPAQARGKRLFERDRRNDGSLIPETGRCVNCHFPPLYTDRMKHDMGLKFEYDRDSLFDTPHLNNVYETPPYLHNGAALTLEEIWTKYSPHDQHGATNDMTKDQLNDLIEFLKTL